MTGYFVKKNHYQSTWMSIFYICSRVIINTYWYLKTKRNKQTVAIKAWRLSTMMPAFWFARHRRSHSMLFIQITTTLLPAKVYFASSPPKPQGTCILWDAATWAGLCAVQWFQYSSISCLVTLTCPVEAIWCRISWGRITGHRRWVTCCRPLTFGLDLSLMGILTNHGASV